MRLITDEPYDNKSPICFFMDAEFKTRDTLFQIMDFKQDIRRHFKLLYRYYGDVYYFNHRDGDCLSVRIYNNYIFGLIICPYKTKTVDYTAVKNSLIRLRNHINKNHLYRPATEHIGKIYISLDYSDVSQSELENMLNDIFALVEIDICLI